MPNERLQSFNIQVRNYLFLINYTTSEEAVSHNVLYYQQLSIQSINQPQRQHWSVALTSYVHVEQLGSR